MNTQRKDSDVSGGVIVQCGFVDVDINIKYFKKEILFLKYLVKNRK